jgi:imidazolonepropionase-like amidohydrolase
VAEHDPVGCRHRRRLDGPVPLAPAVVFALTALLLGCGGGGQALVGVTVIDGLGNPPAADRVVVIRDGRIAEVAAADGWQAPPGVQAIKLPGRFVMPGLIDLRARVTIPSSCEDGAAGQAIDRDASERVLSTLLGFGVTAVRDPAAPAAAAGALGDAVVTGEVPGPRILTTAGEALADARTPLGPFFATGSLRDRLDWLERVDLDGDETREMIAALAERQVVFDPTLIAYHTRFFGDDPSHFEDPELNLAPAVCRAAWRRSMAADDWTPPDFERAHALWPRLLELTRRLHDGGVPLAAGSDLPSPWVIPGVSLHHELRLLHDAGIPPLEVLKIATFNGARGLGLEHEIGSIEPGKAADLIVLAADPIKDLRNTRAISHVFLGGRFVDPAALLAAD